MLKVAPKVTCGDRSGYLCTKVVSLYSPHCGDPSHFPGANGGVPVPRQRLGREVQAAVTEDGSVDDTPDLDAVTFDAMDVQVTSQALNMWGRHPTALQAKIRDALIRGGYWRTKTGGHLLEIGRHQLVLSSDGRRCESYTLLPEPPPRTCAAPIDALMEPAWDRNAVDVDPDAVRQFTGRHRVDEDTAARELLGLLDDAARGMHHRAADGSHRMSHRGFTVVLSPDGATIIGYQTSHAERTPSEVRDKVPSRFGRASHRGTGEVGSWAKQRDHSVGHPPRDRWLKTLDIPKLFDPEHAWITSAVVDDSVPNRSALLDAVRRALGRAARAGRWVHGTAGCHNLSHAGRVWIISPDGRGVLNCKPAWPTSSDPATAGVMKDDAKPSAKRRGQCERCDGKARKGRKLCIPCAQEAAAQHAGKLPAAVPSGKTCDLCGQPSWYPVCDSCDRNLRRNPEQAPPRRDRLHSVSSVVSGGLPSLGKRR